MATPKDSEASDIQQDRILCQDVMKRKIAEHPGIRAARLDPSRGVLEFDFDPEKATHEEIESAADALKPVMRRMMGKCTMRLQGRGCEACARKIEQRLTRQPGVHRATASFIGGAFTVVYDSEEMDKASVVEKARASGADVIPLQEALAEEEAEAALRHGSLSQRMRYWTSGQRLEALFAFVGLVTMFAGLISNSVFEKPLVANVCYFLSYVFGGYYGLLSAVESLKERTLDIDLLMILAALGAAYVGAPFEGAMLLFLFAFSNVLQSYAIGRTRNAIKNLARLKPKEARVLKDGEVVLTPLSDVRFGASVLIRPGDNIPLDGEVIEGESSVDQSSVTGESVLVDKRKGEPVYAGTTNKNGSLTVRVTKEEKDSTLARMVEMVEEAQSQKAATERFLESAEQSYAVGVILFTLALMGLLPTLMGLSFDEAFYRAITVMVVASPCAIVISTPATVLSAIGNAAKRGILFKGGAYLERTSRITAVAFDKTGTLTHGTPQVASVTVFKKGENTEAEVDELLRLAGAVEARSEHPLAQAVVKRAQERKLNLPNAQFFQSYGGRGAMAEIEGQRIILGSPKWFGEFKLTNRSAAEAAVEERLSEGHTAIMVGRLCGCGEQVEVMGILALSDKIREVTPGVVARLKKLGIRKVVMLTGDSERVARRVATECGIDEYYAQLMPEDKVRIMHSLGAGEEFAMVGDGTNDAPALAASLVGIAMGAAGSDVALDSADVVLMSSDLEKVPYAISLSRKARQIVTQNLIFSGGIILLMVLATLLLPSFGMEVPLPLGVLAHEGGTVLVCLNGLRLLAFSE